MKFNPYNNKLFESDEKQHEQLKKELDEKYEKICEEIGLKIYAPEGDVDINEYPELEWDRENKKYRRFKYANSSKPKQNTRSASSQTNEPENDRIVIFLMIIAWVIFIGGFISGIVLGKETKIIESRFSSKTETEEVFSFAKAMIYWFASLVSGAVFLALSAIIDRLNKIKESLKSN